MKPTKQAAGTKRLAVMSCIHGNVPALEAVLRDIELQPGIEHVWCLGDLVGYGPSPNEVVEILKARDITIIRGCWDEGIGHESESCGCAFVSEEEGVLGSKAFHWTRGEVYSDTIEYLRNLPFAIQEDHPCGRLLFVHGSPASTSEYLTATTHELVLYERASRRECDILLCGHTHVPFVRQLAGTLTVKAQASLDERTFRPAAGGAQSRVSLAGKTIVNAGSVGEPRHGGLDATYVILDAVTGEVEIRAVPYPVDRTAALMRDKGVDQVFIDRLLRGQELAGKQKEVVCAC